ncbi:MAG: hypothetical protein PF692_05130 [Kiritimatiellae bacterium]|jgi:hypothetical protein|nr:hypothetical protein [Kiritimatiellia bacterium]
MKYDVISQCFDKCLEKAVGSSCGGHCKDFSYLAEEYVEED